MSLVNDMLRDLDQRRKESNGSSGAVRLTPASDYPSDSRKILLPLVLFGLILTSGAIWYYWAQLSQSNTEQQLDIQLGSALTESTPAPELIVQETREVVPPASETLEPQSSRVSPVESQSSPVGLRSNPVESQAGPVQSVVDEPEIASTREHPNAASEQLAAIGNPITTRISEPVRPSTELNAEVVSEVQIVEAAESSPPSSIASESVKDAPEFSNEQLDTIAVQEALRLISNDRTSEAYTILGNHIESNRYASQSREFYAQLLMSQGRIQAAYELVEAGLTLAPNHQGFKKVKARLLLADGQIEEAVRLLISRAPDISEDTEYHDILAGAQLVMKDYEGAAISYRGLVEQDQSQGKWWYGFALSQDRMGNVNAARQAYGQAIQYSNLSANLRRRSQDRLSALSP